MISICAWCGQPIAAPSLERAGTSHGMCGSCLERRLAALASRRAPPLAVLSERVRRWLAPHPA